jgi:hypothetical protein
VYPDVYEVCGKRHTDIDRLWKVDRSPFVYIISYSLMGRLTDEKQVILCAASQSAASMRCELDMGKSWNAIIHADYGRTQLEEENRWQITISL